jgi:tetratricopeptide (TPR) repeat protein
LERGKVYLALGKRRKAEDDFDKAINLNDKNTWAYLELGKMRLAERKHEEALTLLTSAERHSEGKYGAPLYWRGNVYCALKDWEHALEDYGDAIGRKYDTAELRYNRAAVYYELGELENARDDLKAALKLDPDNAQCTWALERVEQALAQKRAAEGGQLEPEDAQDDDAPDDDGTGETVNAQ